MRRFLVLGPCTLRSKEFGKGCNQVSRAFCAALPRDEYLPTGTFQDAAILFVPLAILATLVPPESPVRGGLYSAIATTVQIPESIHEQIDRVVVPEARYRLAQRVSAG